MPSTAKVGRLDRGTALTALACLPVLGWGQAPDVDTPHAPIALREGTIVTSSQRADQKIDYLFDAAAGKTYLIEVEQKGLDLIVTVADPGHTSRSYNSPLMRDGSEFVLLDSAQSGTYRLTLRCEEYTGAGALPTISVRTLDPGAGANEIRAWRLMTQGAISDPHGAPVDAEGAAKAYAAASEQWAVLGRSREQAQALFSLAMLEYWRLSNWDQSAARAEAAAEIYRALNNVRLYGKAIYVQGYALVEAATGLGADSAQTAFRRALSLLQESHRIYEALGDAAFDLAQIKNNIGYTYFAMGEWDSARPYWEAAAQLYADLNEWGLEVQPLQNLAAIAGEEGQLTAAIDAFERILAVLPEEALLRRATNLNNLGESHRNFGNFDEALEAFSAARDIHQTIGDVTGQGQSLVGLGLVYASLGELELAVDFLERALPITVGANDFVRQEVILRYLGNIAYERREFISALQLHEKALANAASPPNQARIRMLLARDLRALDRFDEAADFAEEARRVAEQAGARQLAAEALLQLGLAKSALSRHEEAQSSLERALDIYEVLDLRADQADALHALGLVARARGDLEKALQDSEAALQRLESSRARVSDPELRAFYSAQRRSYYETHLDLLMEMALHSASGESSDQYLFAALAVSERAKARMLIDLLADASVDLDPVSEPGTAARRGRLYEQLLELRHQRDRILDQGVLGPDAESSLVAIVGDMASVENELNLLEAELRGELEPGVGQTLGAAEIQNLIEPGSVLLQYMLGEHVSYLLAVEPASIRAFALATRSVIETSARRTFDALHTYPRSAAARRELDESLRELSRLVLTPAADLIAGKRLLISPDGALQYVPFGALPSNDVTETGPLLAVHDIVIVPSMTALAAQRQRGTDISASKTLAIFADPVFARDDPRLGGSHVASAGRALGADLLSRSSLLDTSIDLPRLQASGVEAQSIAALVPVNQRLVATGFDATVANVRRAALNHYTYLHFATHGLVDSRYPALSALALSSFNERGERIDGWLRLHDIYDMKLNADLVVLSACETALGREIRGEGLVGLTQAFIYAGADSLVATLWQVSDRATSELMVRFYKNMLENEQPPAQALRAAQLSIAADRRWSDPYFWGAFVFQGDWH